MSDPRNARAVALASTAVNASSVQAVAIRLGYSRPALSRYLGNDYPGVEKIEAAIFAELDKRDCPHTGEPVAIVYCRGKAVGPRPFGGRARGEHWDACQNCEHKPSQGEKS